MPHRLTLLFILGALFALFSGHAAAEVRRCVTQGGQEVFTDRKCDEVGATERVPREQARAAAAGRVQGGGCMRNLQDLVFEMTTAIDAHDANRLASLYHWTGMSSDAGYQIWSRLDAIASRPLVDIVPVMSGSPQPSAQASRAVDGDGESRTSNDAGEPVSTVSATPAAHDEASDPDLYPQTAIRRTPVALRVEQTIGSSATPSRTVFNLLRHFDCWWVRF